jgi:putative heme-binding domain-containing protein
VLVQAFSKLSAEEKSDALSSLASSADGALALLKAVDAKVVPRESISPFLIRQIQSFNEPRLKALIPQIIGTVNEAKSDLPQRKEKFRALLTPAKLKSADLAQGKLIFTATCGTCHRLQGEGANVGPDLTGSNRANLDYLLDNVLDPNAVIGKDYQLNLFSMKDGRVLSGIMKEESAVSYRVVMPGGVEFTLAKADVMKREVSKFSTMPEGLFDAFPPEMLASLVAYLQAGQAPAVKP